MAYEVYYWGACADFYGRALSPLLILEDVGRRARQLRRLPPLHGPRTRDLIVHGGRRRERAAGRPR